jgi:excisionase family DNA binding protein
MPIAGVGAVAAVQLLAPEEVAARLCISREQVLKLMRASSLPYIRIGRFYRVSEADLAGFVEACRAGTGSGLRVRPRRVPA